jgi:pyridoxine/pyridoxamine 5'-phosphate oxidase
MTAADFYTFLSQFRLGVLSTIADGDTPRSALVGIAITEKLELIFDTLRSSRKSRNVLARPACSFVIGWAAEQTVQYEGDAHLLHDAELNRYQPAYFKTWPECRSHQEWPDIAYFLVRPRWARYSDFTQTPPLIHELTF